MCEKSKAADNVRGLDGPLRQSHPHRTEWTAAAGKGLLRMTLSLP